MEVNFKCGNTTIILRDGRLWLAIFRGENVFEKISIKDVIDDVKAVAKIFLGVDELPDIDSDKCDELTISNDFEDAYFINCINYNGDDDEFHIIDKKN